MKITDWGNALELVQNGEAQAEDAARFACDNGIDIEYYEPNERTYKTYHAIMNVYNDIKARQPKSIIPHIETPNYLLHENVDDGPTGHGI